MAPNEALNVEMAIHASAYLMSIYCLIALLHIYLKKKGGNTMKKYSKPTIQKISVRSAIISK